MDQPSICSRKVRNVRFLGGKCLSWAPSRKEIHIRFCLFKSPTMSGSPEQRDSDIHSLSSYNIRGMLGGVGRPILLEAVHEMRDGHDVQQLVSSSRCTQEIMMDKQFGWSLARVLSESYPFSSVPIELTDVVCILIHWLIDFNIYVLFLF